MDNLDLSTIDGLRILKVNNNILHVHQIKPPYYFNLILGNIACAQANTLSLGLMIKELPENSIWSVGGVGNTQLPMNAMAIITDGGVRVGLEDNIWYDNDRQKLATNYELIERVVGIAKSLGHQPYRAEEVRELLNLIYV